MDFKFNTGSIEDGLSSFFGQIDSQVEQEAVDKAKRDKTIRSERILSDLLRGLLSKRKINEKDVNTVMQITIQKFVEAVQAQAITIYFVKEDKIHFEFVYYSSSLYTGDQKLREIYHKKAEQLKQLTLPLGKGIVGKVIETGEPYASLDAANDPNFFAGIDADTGFQTKSMITVPIRANDVVIGAIQCLNKNPETGSQFFSEKDLRLLEEIADYSANLIAKVRNPEQVFTEDELAQYIARLNRCEYVDLKDYEPDGPLWNLVGQENILKFLIMPMKKLGTSTLKVAMDNPLHIQRRDSFQLATNLEIEIVCVSTKSLIEKIIKNFYRTGPDGSLGDVVGDVSDDYTQRSAEHIDVDTDVDEESAPIIKLANRLIEDAYSRGASDIHIEPFENETLVRYRVDGVLGEVAKLPKAALNPLVSRLKIMSELDISERRLPQDGRIKFKNYTRTGIDIDLRVATGPMVWGEKVVMRILDKSSTSMGLNVMGFSEPNVELYRKSIEAPYGMILHVGPTGSGKTTTLYAALNEINSPNINIQTAEDPVEYNLHGVNQMQMHKDIGLTFAAALKCYLRQDPDVILVGEIRDFDTASIAIEAALTGHLMFSTLHTNDAPGTVTRFIEMGIEPFLISSSLLVVCAQRLMRRLCKCKREDDATPEEIEVLKCIRLSDERLKDGVKLGRIVGCDRCKGTGYKGRTGTHELLTMTPQLIEKVNQRVSTEELREIAIRDGMLTLWQDSMEKVWEGITTIEEAGANVMQD
ncbi:MAG: ATPase, T2SS/T4P/T4SS family [Planctomycetota bacterium]|jgi:type IV pilus assembly protein PilB